MKYFLSIIFFCFCFNVSAQEKHFIFIQSDNKQPFYVSLNSKLYSSTASGYVIIPKLSEGNYNLTVGFEQNSFPEQTFTCVIQNKDLGFDLKNLNERGWALFNLQTLDLTMASTSNSNVVANALIENSNTKAQPAVITFEKKKDTVAVLLKTGEIAKNELPKEKVNEGTAIKEAAPEQIKDVESIEMPIKIVEDGLKKAPGSNVKKLSETVDEAGVHLKYVEGSVKGRDTISVTILSSPETAATNSQSPRSLKSSTDTTVVDEKQVLNSSNKSDVRFLDITVGGQKESQQAMPANNETRQIMENSNCKAVASDDDYAKLRKKMAMETTDEKMIGEAKKYYRNKCFTTNQIKLLSTLFLSDEGRYNFFSASFASVSDATQYSTLQSEFIDPTYINRFKMLVQ